MKFIIPLILCAIALTSAQKYKSRLYRVTDLRIRVQQIPCAEDLKIPFPDIDKYSSLDKVANNPLGRCFLKCIAEKLRVYDETEEYNFDLQRIVNEVMEYKPPYGSDVLLSKLENCTKETNKQENPCDKVYDGIKCVMENI